MSRKKQISALALVLLLTLSIAANAMELRGAGPHLSFSGTTAYCDVAIRQAGSIDATIRLWQGETCLKTWSATGSNSIDFSCSTSVTKGKTYRLTVDFTVNGKSQPQASTSGTC